MYTRSINRLIQKYGTVCTIKPFSGSAAVKLNAVINPLLYKNRAYIGGKYIPDGYFDGGHYLFIGNGDIELNNMAAGSLVITEKNSYCVKRAEQYAIADNVIYTWAILQLTDGGESNA